MTCFLGPKSYTIPPEIRTRVRGSKTLHAAFSEAVRSVDPARHSEITSKFTLPQHESKTLADEASTGLKQEQQYIRGLYTGGTLAYETLIILSEMIGDVYSNAPFDSKLRLPSSYQSMKDSIIDLGEEEFTSGRAHSMIDPTLRKIRLVEEAKDSEVAVVLLDVMLGYGSHQDPAGAMLSAIREARSIVESDGRALPILAHVCGTEQDPQVLSEQERKLREAGVRLFKTNATMAISGALISKRNSLNRDALASVYGHFVTGFE